MQMSGLLFIVGTVRSNSMNRSHACSVPCAEQSMRQIIDVYTFKVAKLQGYEEINLYFVKRSVLISVYTFTNFIYVLHARAFEPLFKIWFFVRD